MRDCPGSGESVLARGGSSTPEANRSCFTSPGAGRLWACADIMLARAGAFCGGPRQSLFGVAIAGVALSRTGAGGPRRLPDAVEQVGVDVYSPRPRRGSIVAGYSLAIPVNCCRRAFLLLRLALHMSLWKRIARKSARWASESAACRTIERFCTPACIWSSDTLPCTRGQSLNSLSRTTDPGSSVFM